MTLRIPLMVSSLLLSASVSAHQVWIERAQDGAAKVYYGEPAAGELEKAGGGLDKIDPIVFHSDKGRALAEARHADHIVVSGAGSEDLRLVVEAFPLWTEADGSHQRAVYYAREGRAGTGRSLDLELVPESAGSDRFVLFLRGAPAADREVALLAPGGWSKTLKTDAQGRVELPTPWAGRYIAEAVIEEEAKSQVEGKTVSKTYHVSTISFTDGG
jgi:uncharacterized GH25 family protein